MKNVDKKTRNSLENLKLSQANEILFSTLSSESTPILAVDYGEKYSGLAISHEGICALPISTIPTEDLHEYLRLLLKEKKIKQLIFGLPISGDGQEKGLCEVIRKFAKGFETLTEVHFINERGSTQNTISPKYDLQRKDDLAAAQILEFFLMSLHV